MIPVEYMLFDLDGTLIDSKADLARSINLMLADLGRAAIPEEAVASFVGDGVHALVQRALTATDPNHEPPSRDTHAQGLALMRKHYGEQMLVKTRLYPRVAETLTSFALKRKAVVTSKETGFTRTILEHLGIADHFDSIIGDDTVSERKPHPAPVFEALNRLGGRPERAVMIGDSETDIRAGRAAGTVTCAVSYGFRTRAQLEEAGPDILLDSFDQMGRFFC